MSKKNTGMTTGVRPRGDGFEWSVFVKDAGCRYNSADAGCGCTPARGGKGRARRSSHRVRLLSVQEETEVRQWLERFGNQDTHDATAVLIDTGMRPSELWWVAVKDVTRPTRKSPMVLLVYGRNGRGTKTSDFRSIPCTKCVTEIMEHRCQGLAENDRPLGLSTQWFHDQWRKVREQRGMDDDQQFDRGQVLSVERSGTEEQ